MGSFRGAGRLRLSDHMRLDGFGARSRLERFQAAAEFHGREVARFLRQAKFGKSARQTSQLIRKAREHARAAWGAAVRADAAAAVCGSAG